jgi:hypothetical protein
MKKWMFSIIAAAGLLISVESSAQTKTVSRARKNTVIGAGAGAATGAVISKKKGKGAIIGGAVGAGAGYAWGKHKDKKKGRKVVNHS